MPIGDRVESGQPPDGIGDGDSKSLRGQKFGEPTAHFAVTADHQGALAAAVRLRRHARLFLGGQRGLNELPQQRFGQIRRHPEFRGGRSATQYDFALTAEVAGCPPGGTLDGGHLLAQGLAAGHQFQQPPVELRQSRSQFIQIHRRDTPV